MSKRREWPASGTRFGRLQFVRGERPDKAHCLCDCGASKAVRIDHLLSGATKSCGCYMREVTGRLAFLHGASSGGTRTPEFRVWVGMRKRTLSVGSQDYQRYGAKGIGLCDRWLDFPSFLADMGPRPSPKHSIDRIDGTKGYSPDNCRWATAEVQARNKASVKLSMEKARAIRALNQQGIPNMEISRRLGVGYSSVKQICYGKQWKEPTVLWEVV